MGRTLTPEIKAARRAELAEAQGCRQELDALYNQATMIRVAPKPEVAEPTTYRVVALPSAVKRKAAAEKAARTRRLRRQSQG